MWPQDDAVEAADDLADAADEDEDGGAGAAATNGKDSVASESKVEEKKGKSARSKSVRGTASTMHMRASVASQLVLSWSLIFAKGRMLYRGSRCTCCTGWQEEAEANQADQGWWIRR